MKLSLIMLVLASACVDHSASSLPVVNNNPIDPSRHNPRWITDGPGEGPPPPPPIPEPTTVLLFTSGVLAAGLLRRRSTHKST
jgi:PEP-CTERM motif